MTLMRVLAVSVPLRGKEGAGLPLEMAGDRYEQSTVSVPLRGKEGAGLSNGNDAEKMSPNLFPSPCGVRRVRDFVKGFNRAAVSH